MQYLFLIAFVAALTGCIEPPPSTIVDGQSSDGGTDTDELPDRVAATTGRDASADTTPTRDSAADQGTRGDAADAADAASLADADEMGPDLGPLGGEALLIVGDAAALSGPEMDLRSFLESEGFTVSALSDENASDAVGTTADVVVMTRTTSSTTAGASLRPLAAPLVHWEHAQQWSDYTGMVTDASDAAPAALTQASSIWVDPSSPDALRCGVSGEVVLYAEDGWDVSFAQPASLGADAIRVATVASDDARVPYYAYPAGSTLADGSTAAGTRVYLGIDRDSFPSLTPEALGLFRCALRWAMYR